MYSDMINSFLQHMIIDEDKRATQLECAKNISEIIKNFVHYRLDQTLIVIAAYQHDIKMNDLTLFFDIFNEGVQSVVASRYVRAQTSIIAAGLYLNNDRGAITHMDQLECMSILIKLYLENGLPLADLSLLIWKYNFSVRQFIVCLTVYNEGIKYAQVNRTRICDEKTNL